MPQEENDSEPGGEGGRLSSTLLPSLGRGGGEKNYDRNRETKNDEYKADIKRSGTKRQLNDGKSR